MTQYKNHKSLGIFVFFALFLFNSFASSAQCTSFARTTGKPKLGDYLHDGNYNATVLGAGETAELYKTFFKGQKYRIAVSKVENLPDIHFRLVDEENNIIFDNKDHEYTDVWDFTVETTQMMVIKLKVLDNYNNKEVDTTKGCVCVLFGINKEKIGRAHV